MSTILLMRMPSHIQDYKLRFSLTFPVPYSADIITAP